MKDSKAEVLDFWFIETAPVQWFQRNDVFDDMIRERFLPIYEMARNGFCETWKNDADGCLALCLILDQFPRNMFRATPKAFESDDIALEIARSAIAKGFDQVFVQIKKRFLYLPFQHSENLEDQKRSVELFEATREEDPLSYEYAIRHLRIIEKYGRFPHRNVILKRDNSPDEIEYLSHPDAGF